MMGRRRDQVIGVGLDPQGKIAGTTALEVSPAEDPRAILQGMHSVDLAAFCSQSQCTRRNTKDGSSLAQVEPRHFLLNGP